MQHTQKFSLRRLIGLLPFVGLLLILMGTSSAHATDLTLHNFTETQYLANVTYGNGLFLATGFDNNYNPVVVTSPDGSNWSNAPAIAGLPNVQAVTYGNGLFVASGTDSNYNPVLVTSTDGSNWSNASASAGLPGVQAVTYGNGVFVASGYDSNWNPVLVTSPDGSNWSSGISTALQQVNDITYGSGLFVARGYDSNYNPALVTSPDGSNWSDPISIVALSVNGLAYGNGVFVAIGYDSNWNSVLLTSPDGSNWSDPISTGLLGQLRSVTYSNGLFVVLSDDAVATSSDGSNWIIQNIPAATYLWAVTYGNDLYVMVGLNGVGGYHGVAMAMSSPAGVVASAPTVSAINPVYGVTAGGTAVTLTGTGFTGATAVSIGDAAATNVTVVSDTSLTATTPAHAAGTASVLVTTPAGTNAANSLFSYYDAPTVSAVTGTADYGNTVGGKTVTITGTGFDAGALNVTIGGIPATNVIVVSATSLTATTPAGVAGTASVLVTSTGGTNAANSLFSYTNPGTSPKFVLLPVRAVRAF